MRVDVARAGFCSMAGCRVAAAQVLGVLVLLVAGASKAAGGQHTDAWGKNSIRSAGGRFVVAAADAADRMMLARWADDVYRRFIEMWSPEQHLPEGRVFGILVDPQPVAAPSGGLERRRSIRQDEVILALRLENTATLCGESFVESVCAMIIDAMILESQSAEERVVFEETAPDWLTTGVAQNLYPSLRSRNQALVIELWQGGDLPGAGEILSWRHLPEHRTFAKAVSGIWVAWAAGRWPKRTAALQHWITLCAEGWTIDPERVFDAPGIAGIDEWDHHAAELQRLFIAAEGVPAAVRYARLRQVLHLYSGVSGIPDGIGIPAGAGLDALVSWRRRAWFARFMNSRRNDLTSLVVADDPDYQELVKRAIAFIDVLESRRPEFMVRREFRAIMDILEEQEKLALLRAQYVSLYEREQRHDPFPVSLDIGDRPDILPFSRWRSYVDKFDKP